jgi:hypothetical protein
MYIVERIVDGKAVLECDNLTHVLVSLPFDVKEGDVLNDNLDFDRSATESRRKIMSKKQNELWK